MSGEIAIGYCTGGTIDNPFMESLIYSMVHDGNDRKLISGVLREVGLYIDDNRNALVQKFLKHTQSKYLLFLDTDIEFTPQTIYRLYDLAEAGKLPILSAMYVSHIIDGKLRPVWFVKGPESHGGVQNIGQFNSNSLCELAACGMGCCLIRRDVFETLATHPDHQKDGWTWFGREGFLLKGTPAHLGEDVSFCLRARTMGFKTWGHSGIRVKHWKKTALDFELFELLYREAQRTERPY
jgi:GT2 family glycosyltransferase